MTLTRLDTQCVHGGTAPDGTDRPLVPPIVQSTSYLWEGLDGRPPRSYAREGNPTVDALEARLGALEGGEAVCFASGLAAIDATIRLVRPGGRIVVGQHVYGGTTRLLAQVHHGLEIDTVDTSDAAAVEEALSRPVDLVIVETPSNPTLRITDLQHLIYHAGDAIVAVDNTFATPLHQRPLDLGADLSIHSTTKYLDGHGATLGGAVVVHPRHGGAGIGQAGTLAQRLRWVRCATGAVLAPFEAWLTLQGTKTLHLRTARQWATAQRVAQELAAKGVAVHYPGLAQHPGHEVHARQCRGGGGIVAIDLGSLDGARAFVEALRLWSLAENLGSTESLVSSPALMTHAALPPERRLADGIPDGLVRLSVGVEDPDELLADLHQALETVLCVS